MCQGSGFAWKSSCSVRPCRRWRSHSCSIQPAGPPIAYLPSPNSLPAQDSLVTRHRFSFAACLLAGFMLAGPANVFAMPSPIETRDVPGPLRATSTATRFSQAQPAPAPQTPAAPAADPATDAQAAGDEPIGNVATLTGIATVIRKRDSIALKLKDDIFQNDVLQTSANSTLGVTFNDATTFNLTANARITVDNYVYEDGGRQNAALFDVVKGTVAFVAAAVAKTGDMKISTPTATMGIRGTSGLVEVPEGASATSRNNVAIKLYPDADGRVGRIEVNDRAGARLGFLTQGSSGFAIRPGTGGARFAAVPLTITPQMIARDQGFVRQVHSTQLLGRRVFDEQRAFRRANPGFVNPNRPIRQPGQQPGQFRQNGLPGQPGGRQNGLPGQNRPGQQQQPGLQNRPGQQQPGAPNRQGLPGQPGQPPLPAQPG